MAVRKNKFQIQRRSLLDNVALNRDDIITQAKLAHDEIKAIRAVIENCQEIIMGVQDELISNVQKLSQI